MVQESSTTRNSKLLMPSGRPSNPRLDLSDSDRHQISSFRASIPVCCPFDNCCTPSQPALIISYNQGSWDTDLSLVLPLEPAHDDFIVHARCHPVHFTQAKSGPCEYFYIK
jgi:hypothetical protein